MQVLVVGASGATGRLLVTQLLNAGHDVRAVVRNVARLPDELRNDGRLSIIQASLLELGANDLARTVEGCQAIASCLGHTMSWKGIYGQPRRLVTDAVRRLCKAVKTNQPESPVRFVLMNTTGNSNRDIDEPVSLGHQLVIGLLRLLLPPHVDNEQAADFLRTEIGQTDEFIEWIAVRPDSLTDEDSASAYAVYPSPIRSAIFDAGTTSRINVAHFMANLITDDDLWLTWMGQMPVIYNKTSTPQ